MAKQASTGNVKSLKAKVKWKASVSSDSVALRSSLRSGKGPGVSFNVPTEARVLETANYVYLSIPALTGMFRKDGKRLVEVPDDASVPSDLEAEVSEAMKAQAPAKKGKAASVALPDELVKKLSDSIPAGYKLALKNGDLVLVKARAKKK